MNERKVKLTDECFLMLTFDDKNEMIMEKEYSMFKCFDNTTNTVLVCERPYVNEKLHGIVKQYDNIGRLIQTMEYKDGLPLAGTLKRYIDVNGYNIVM